MVLGCFSVFTFFYAVPFIWNKNLRKFSGLKIFVVAIVWGGVAVIVPLVASESQITTDNWLTFLQIVIIVITLTIPFEIRDLPYDARELKTLPQDNCASPQDTRVREKGVFLQLQRQPQLAHW